MIRKADHWTPDESGQEELAREAATILEGAYIDAAGEAIGKFSLPVSFDTIMPDATIYGDARGAELVGMKRLTDGTLVENPNARWVISDTERESVNSLLGEALDEGASYQEFSSYLDEMGIFEEWRADMIARTEIGLAMIGGKKQAMAEADVEYGIIFDGDGCDECGERNGAFIAIDEFELLHPNCVADIRPATPEELADEGIVSEEEEEEEAA